MESTYLAQGLAQHHTPSPRLEKERLPNYNLVKKIQNCIYMSWEYQKRDLKKIEIAGRKQWRLYCSHGTKMTHMKMIHRTFRITPL